MSGWATDRTRVGNGQPRCRTGGVPAQRVPGHSPPPAARTPAAMTSPDAPTASGFYITGGTLRADAPSYVERQADRDLFESLQAGEYCYLLNTRQMGKSSLMVRTAVRLRGGAREAGPGHRIVVLDLTSVGQNLSPEQWYDGLLTLVGRQLGLEDALDDYWQEHANLGPLQRFLAALTEIALPADPSPLTVFLDEIDAVRSLPFSTDEFFAGIRSLYNARTRQPELARLTFALIGVATPADLIAETRMSPFNIGRRIRIRDFTFADARHLAEAMPGGESVLRRILHWTGGQPYLTQRLCRALAESPDGAGPGTVDELCRRLFLSKAGQESDDNLAFVRNRLLRSEADLASLLDLYQKVRSDRRVADDETNPLCAVLKLAGVAGEENGQLRVRNRIYDRVFDREWVREHMPGAELRRQRAAFRRGVARAAAVSGIVVSVMGGLTLYAVGQTRVAREATRDLWRNLYVSDMIVGQQALRDGDLVRLSRLLEAHRPRSGGEDLRGFEWRYLRGSYQRRSLPIVGRRGAPVGSVAFCPDPRLLAIGRQDGTVELWDIVSRRQQRAPEAHAGPVVGAAFSRDGRLLATGSCDGTVKLWSIARQEVVRTLSVVPRSGSVPLAFSDGDAMLAVGSPSSVVLWNLAGGWARHQLRVPEGEGVGCLAFSPRGRLLATGTASGVHLWDAVSRRLLTRFQGHEEGMLFSVAFAPDGRTLASGSFDQTARIWDVATGRHVLTLREHRGMCRAVAFSPDGRTLATGSHDGTVILWDPATGRSRARVPGEAPVSSLAFSGDGRTLAIGSDDGAVRLLDLTRGSEDDVLRGGERAAWALTFSPDGKTLARGTQRGTVELWSVSTGMIRARLPGRRGTVWSLAFSPDGKTLAAACGLIARSDRPGYVTFWDPRTGEPASKLRAGSGEVDSVAYSPDGRYLLTGGPENQVKLWDVRTRALLDSFIGDVPGWRVFALFSPDGGTIGSGSWNHTVELRPFRSQGTVRTLTAHQAFIITMAFSPDGRMVATGGNDRVARLWDTRSGRRIADLEGHVGVIWSLAFSPDGRTLASGSEDHTVKLWSIATRQDVATFQDHQRAVRAVAFSPDGTILASTGGDGTVRLWRAAPLAEADARPGGVPARE